jgi:hypothetical protein
MDNDEPSEYEDPNQSEFKSKSNEMTVKQQILRDYEETSYGRSMSQ